MNKIQLNINEITTTPLFIGFEGEKNYTEITFYWTTLYFKYPDAVASMVIRPPVGDAYPKTITQDADKVVWTVSASDTVNPGKGEYQITFTNGDEIIKSYIGTFNLMDSITGNGEAPTPVEDWLEEANAALDALEDMTASATTLTPGSSATAEITEVGGHKNIAIGVPAGASVSEVTVTGATPSITGEANTRYLCGTLTSLTITPPESGMIDVVFTSGATATTLTATGVTWPAWFTVEKNYKYELSILDGMGVVAAWPTT